jgi:hypothetical protein
MFASNTRSVTARLVGSILLAGMLGGCDGGMGFGVLPLATIDWEQVNDQPNFTVHFDGTRAVTNASNVAFVNWVFGDGSGFETGGVEINHRYVTAGRYNVEAYFFDSDGFVDTVRVTINVTIPAAASGPIPANQASNVPIDTSLGWTPGSGGITSILYLGTSLPAVQAGAPEALQGEFGESLFTPAALTGGTDYYWRVDTRTSDEAVAGPVWTFRTADPPGPMTDPTPADGATGVALDTALQWTAGTSANRRDVFFGTSAAAVDSAGPTSAEFQGNQTTTVFQPDTALANDTQYFWRVDEIGPGGTQRGPVLSFRTAPLPGQISNASPADLAVDVAVDAMLSWTAGSDATSHDVYLGTTRQAVADATKASPFFRGNQQQTTFEPSLTANLSFFWRIDEVGPGGTTKGIVREFKTAQAPTVASDFIPADNEIEIALQPTLEWTAGQHAAEQFVYFGDDRTAVAAAGANDESGILRATLPIATTSFAPAAEPLNENTPYYWRIDTRGPGGTAPGPVLTFTTRDPTRAGDPSPAHRAEDVALNAVLSWTAGTQGGPPLSHDVYLGQNEGAVTNATTASSVFVGNFPAGTLTFTPASLDPNAQYFWRIDERYDPANPDVEIEVAKGKVWSFSTVEELSEKATAPSPASGAIDVDLNADLSWTAGMGADSHDVYFGTDQAAVAGATTSTAGIFKGNFTATNFSLPLLTAGTAYYWRIDEVNDVGATTGDVWTFTTLTAPGQISGPIPADGATGQNVEVQLQWTAATNADTYDVYFGTDQSAVTAADHGSATFKGSHTTTQFDPGTLTASTTYYWRIDPVNEAGTTTGAVFSFTTGVLPGKAGAPSPADMALNIGVTADLSWSAGANAVSYDVYLGTDEAAVIAATPDASHSEFRGNQSALTYDPGTLMSDTQYFWRIDSVAPGGTTKGDLWRFRTAAAPTQAQLIAANGDGPANASVGLLLRPLLQWTPGTGPGTLTHDVYIGTSQTAVDAATRVSPEFKQNQPGNTFEPGAIAPLAAATRYYWRIDEVDSLGGTTKGAIWQFDTTPATRFVILDPADVAAGASTLVTIQVQDAGGNVVTNFQADVTLDASGGAAGGGLVDIVNGVGMVLVNSAIPQTVTLSLTDSANSGLNVTSTQDVQFN